MVNISDMSNPTCPKCRRPDRVVPVLWGLPSPRAMEAAKRGEILLAGCVVPGNEPLHVCRRCRIWFDFGRPELVHGKAAKRGWVEDTEDWEQFGEATED